MGFLKDLDGQAKVMWPYPAEQTQWLVKMTKKLEGKVLDEVRTKEEEYLKLPKYVLPTATVDILPTVSLMKGMRYWSLSFSVMLLKKMRLPKTRVWSGATSDGRELDVLDCAFLARLAVFLKRLEGKAEECQLEDPPHKIANDVKAVGYHFWYTVPKEDPPDSQLSWTNADSFCLSYAKLYILDVRKLV
ncbi:hypothetical protein RvY_17972-1 [Ramazzottius varieornatus]|uniref:Uncharacterized protein n=1 Tax=Ramazzottius varieornatus TaxID=947166 RepID=A0A1D1W7P3_RAMVA|nr:hypothetical protein RvY_17972-1 [Ramazzottius varieornatus]